MTTPLDVVEEALEPVAYWARFDDGSGKIFEDKQQAENYAAACYTSGIEVIPVYTHAALTTYRTQEKELREAFEEILKLSGTMDMLQRENLVKACHIERICREKIEAIKGGKLP